MLFARCPPAAGTFTFLKGDTPVSTADGDVEREDPPVLHCVFKDGHVAQRAVLVVARPRRDSHAANVPSRNEAFGFAESWAERKNSLELAHGDLRLSRSVFIYTPKK